MVSIATVQLAENITITATPYQLPIPSLHIGVVRKSRAFSMRKKQHTRIKGIQVEIVHPLFLATYRVDARLGTPNQLAEIGANYEAWRSYAYRYAFAIGNYRQGFARITVSVPGKFHIDAFPETVLNTVRGDFGGGWWWLSLVSLPTGTEDTFLFDPDYCTPEVFLAHGETPEWFSRYSKYRSSLTETQLRPQPDDRSNVERQRKNWEARQEAARRMEEIRRKFGGETGEGKGPFDD